MKATPAERVMNWVGRQPLSTFCTTSITQAEILHGIMLLPSGKRRIAIAGAADAMFAVDFGGRILAFGSDARLESLIPDTIRCNDVAQLSRESAFAEKFLANADRGLDASTLARDVIDLAYMAEHWGMQPARAGLRLAEAAYGDDVQRKLDYAIGKIESDRLWRQQCERGLNLDRHKVLRAGLEKLQATRWRKAPAQHGKPD
jgi:hypothetical protein